jgi:hypothetical protein
MNISVSLGSDGIEVTYGARSRAAATGFGPGIARYPAHATRSPGSLIAGLGPRRSAGNRPLARAIRVPLTRS